LKLTFSDDRFNRLFRAIDSSGDGRIEWDELHELLFGHLDEREGVDIDPHNSLSQRRSLVGNLPLSSRKSVNGDNGNNELSNTDSDLDNDDPYLHDSDSSSDDDDDDDDSDDDNESSTFFRRHHGGDSRGGKRRKSRKDSQSSNLSTSTFGGSPRGGGQRKISSSSVNSNNGNNSLPSDVRHNSFTTVKNPRGNAMMTKQVSWHGETAAGSSVPPSLSVIQEDASQRSPALTLNIPNKSTAMMTATEDEIVAFTDAHQERQSDNHASPLNRRLSSGRYDLSFSSLDETTNNNSLKRNNNQEGNDSLKAMSLSDDEMEDDVPREEGRK
jgi:hypothetical protein